MAGRRQGGWFKLAASRAGSHRPILRVRLVERLAHVAHSPARRDVSVPASAEVWRPRF
jgi:hypothetical protein